MNKPPVLSDTEILAIVQLHSELFEAKKIAQAQRDADVEWFNNLLKTHKKYRELREDIGIASAQLALTQSAVQQSRADTAKEIFEEIEDYEEFYCDNDVEFFMSIKQWQSLKSKFLGGSQ